MKNWETQREFPETRSYDDPMYYSGSSSSNDSNANVMRSLPPVSEIEQALNLAQCELRAMYKRLGIKGSNVLDLVDKTLEKVQAAMPS